MSHQDQGLGQDISVNHRSLREAIDWLLSADIFASISFRDGCRWTPLTPVATALLWAWGSSKNVTERFSAARKIISKAFRLQGDLPSYQAFMKVLRKWSCDLLLVVMPHFRVRMEQELPNHFHVAGFVVMAVDGSRVELPRTLSNQEHFSAGLWPGSYFAASDLPRPCWDSLPAWSPACWSRSAGRSSDGNKGCRSCGSSRLRSWSAFWYRILLDASFPRLRPPNCQRWDGSSHPRVDRETDNDW